MLWPQVSDCDPAVTIMIITHDREKLINAIIFFSQKVRFPGKTKLFKLLYFLDFEHYKQKGRSVTGLEYFAWPMGPVPVDLYNEIEAPRPSADLEEWLSFEKKRLNNGNWMLNVHAKRPFDPSHFTKRELQIMELLADEYRETKAEAMVEATHLENQPWHEVYEVRERQQDLIPYELALRKAEEETLRDIAAEREAVINHFRSE